MGKWLIGDESEALSAEDFTKNIKEDFLGTIGIFKNFIIQAIFGWIGVAPFLTVLLYFISYPIFQRILKDKDM